MSFNGKSQSDLLDLFWDAPISQSRNLINCIDFKPGPKKIDRKEWKVLSPNPAAVHLLKADHNQIDRNGWKVLSPNPAAVHLLKADHNQIDFDMVTHHLISRTHINPEDETDSDMPELVPVTETDETDSDMPELVPVTETDDTGEDTNLRFIGQERRHTGMYCHFHEARALETWYIYEDKNSNVIETKTQLHSGKT